MHWNGKLLPFLTSKDKVDHLAVIASGVGVMKLLGVPDTENGTGVAQATTVVGSLTHWGLGDLITATAFDTTSSNTWEKNSSMCFD